MKKLTSVLCAVTLILSAVSCEKKPVADKEKIIETPVVTQLLYKSEKISVLDDMENHISLGYSTNKGTGLLYQSTDSEFFIQYYDKNLNTTEKISLMKEENCQSFYGSLDSNGNACLLMLYAEYDGGPAEDYEKYFDEAEESLIIHNFDENGTETGIIEIENADKYFRLDIPIDNIIYYDGKYIITTPDGYYIFDENGQLISNVNESAIEFTVDSKGKLVSSKWEDFCYIGENMMYSDNATKYGEYVKRTGKLFTGVGAYAFFGVMQQGIYGITADGQAIQLMDFLGSRIMSNEIYDVAYVGEGKFVAYSVSDLGTRSMLSLTVRPDDYVESRQKVVIAMEDLNSYVNDSATEFNKFSNDFETEIRKYEYGTDALKADILSDNAPDVYVYNNADLIQNYTNMGAFEDMYELMDEYGGITKDNILPNILEAMEYKGGLYAIPTTFDVKCNIAWSEVLGREYSNWTTEEFFDFVETMPENMFFGDMMSFGDRKSVFDYLCQDNVEQWIDFDNGTCDFESESFIKMLNLSRGLKIMREEYSTYEDVTAEEMKAESEYNSTLMKKKEVFMGFMVTGMHNISVAGNALYYGLNVDDITFLSAPTKNGGGIICSSDLYSVLNCGNCTEGGWAFVSYLLGEQQQEEIGFNAFPVRKDMFYNCTEKQRKATLDTNSSAHYNYYSFEYDATITEEQYDYIIGFVEKCNSFGGYRKSVRVILDEEYNSFIAGEITAEECAKRIQSRMEIYLSENT